MPDQLVPLSAVRGDALELSVELRPDPQGVVGLALRRSPDGAEETRISYDSRPQQLTLDRSKSTQAPETDRAAHVAPLALADDEPLRLRVFLDRSVIEVFANDRVAITSRIYPSRPDSQGVAAFAEGRPAELLGLTAWRMGSIWG